MALPSKDLHDIISHEMGKIDRRGDYEIRYVSDVGANGIAEITERSKNNGKMVGLSTGFSLLDYCTFGFQKRKLYYVGGRPSQGKTSLLVNFAVNCNDRFGFLSAESGADEILIKLFAKYGNIDSRKLELGTRDSKEFSIMANYVDRESELKSVIYDKPNMDIDDLSFIARSMVESYGCKILFVDYIQILGASFSMKKKDRREQIADISMKLKQLARDLNVPVVVAAQLTRDADKDRPELSSFGESSQIEKDADVAILIWKSVETRTLESKEKVKDTKTYLLLDKNRDGKTAKIEVYFNGASQTFEQI
jgi:replicative DNA helicase